MTDLSDVERDAERAVDALRSVDTYLAAHGRTPAGGDTRPGVLAGEGLAAAERVRDYLRSLRRPGDGASAGTALITGRYGWVPPAVELDHGPAPVRWPYRGDPGE